MKNNSKTIKTINNFIINYKNKINIPLKLKRKVIVKNKKAESASIIKNNLLFNNSGVSFKKSISRQNSLKPKQKEQVKSISNYLKNNKSNNKILSNCISRTNITNKIITGHKNRSTNIINNNKNISTDIINSNLKLINETNKKYILSNSKLDNNKFKNCIISTRIKKRKSVKDKNKSIVVKFINILANYSKNIINFQKSRSIVKVIGPILGFSVNTHNGTTRNYNEDRVSILLNAQQNLNITKKDNIFSCLFSIYDGHGGNGCSNYLKDTLHNYLIDNINIKNNIETQIKRIYKRLDNMILKRMDSSGSCASTLFFLNDKVYAISTGDSRIIFYYKNKVFQVFNDHKPDLFSEFSRIIQSGAELYKMSSNIKLLTNEIHFAKNYKEIQIINKLEEKYSQNKEIIYGPWRIRPGGLSVSRAFGDRDSKLKEYGGIKNSVICEPEVMEISDFNDLEFALIASLIIR